jgi:hypothetical protein
LDKEIEEEFIRSLLLILRLFIRFFSIDFGHNVKKNPISVVSTFFMRMKPFASARLSTMWAFVRVPVLGMARASFHMTSLD